MTKVNERIDEIQRILAANEIDLDKRLELIDELNVLQGKTPKPLDSPYECEGCGS